LGKLKERMTAKLSLTFAGLESLTHTFAACDSAGAAINWMTDRFRGAPAPSSCER
jgi:hypothetical protein